MLTGLMFPTLDCRVATPAGTCGNDLPGDDFEGDWDDLVGDGGLLRRDGRTGFGLPGTCTGLVGDGE